MFGGTPDGKRLMKSAELFVPSTNYSCWLPDLPEAVSDHLSGLRGLLYCGGVNEKEEKLSHCVTWRDGAWVRGPQLDRPKLRGFIWSRAEFSLVMGGCKYCGANTTLRVTTNSSQPSFDLRYNTMLACGVEDNRNSLLYLVGGHKRRPSWVDISRLTQIYGEEGYRGDLTALLNTPRAGGHSCSGYWREDNLVSSAQTPVKIKHFLAVCRFS